VKLSYFYNYYNNNSHYNNYYLRCFLSAGFTVVEFDCGSGSTLADLRPAAAVG